MNNSRVLSLEGNFWVKFLQERKKVGQKWNKKERENAKTKLRLTKNATNDDDGDENNNES